jgi:DNA modification methylase/superfamily II DNA or RNA helicase
MIEYADFLATKKPRIEACGCEPGPVNPLLFGWQTDIVKWALRQGRAAIFADCGMGKTLMQLEWSRQIGRRILIVAPLAVAQQTIQEAEKISVEIRFCAEPMDGAGIWITNYQKLHKFVGAAYDAIVLDESSILKSLDGKTRTMLLEQFTQIPYRLCCTATPSPNDLTELANHAEFLGAMPRREMLATFFVHDSAHGASDGYRLKGHARDLFWRWVAQWAVYLRRPSDLGYPDGAFQLPALNVHQETVESNFVPSGHLFPGLVNGIQGRTEARRKTIEARCQRASEVVSANGEQWLVWCGLNDEGRKLAKALDDCALIEGATPDDRKVELVARWMAGEIKTLIAKPSMFGFGLNFQHCHNVLYLGLGDSFEQWYQSIRRCWRFGQTRDVNVVIVTSDAESEIVDNIKRKERQADELAQSIADAMQDAQTESVFGTIGRKEEYRMRTETGNGWELKLGDCVERIKEVESNSVGLSVFSPPFAKLYCYSASDRDMGNSKSYEQFFAHFRFLIPEIMRVTMPGRLCVVHVQDVAATKVNDGYIGTKDFSGDVRAAFERAGWIFARRVTIDKNPQAQAIRTKAKTLMFVQKNKDSAWSWPALADYLLLFQKPGDNTAAIKTDVTNEEWIHFAHPCWYGIDESDTLNERLARDEKDEAHLCPLQLEVYRRCIRLWSNRGEVVADWFAGIGSCGVVAVEQGRRFIGTELKEIYFNRAERYLRDAMKQESLFVEAAA